MNHWRRCKKNGDSSWIQGAQVFFCLKKARNSGEVSPCVLGQVGHQQNEESKTQRLPREEIIRRMLFFSFSSTLSSVTFLLLAAFTLTHAKEQVSQSNQRASFFSSLSFWRGGTDRERERERNAMKTLSFPFCVCTWFILFICEPTGRVLPG